MKTISAIMLSVMVLAMTACGGGDSIEAKKEKLEKLKAQQAELTAQIATLQDEIVKAGDTASTEDPRSKVIALTTVTKQTFVHGIDIQGNVDGDENITYTAKAPGVVSKIYVKVGDRVSAGQIMAELDSKAQRAQLEGFKAQYELANTVYEKQKSLWEQKIGTEIQYLTAKATKESLEKQVQGAKEGLDMLMIKADYSGTVDMVDLKVGQSAMPGIPAIIVLNPDKLKIKADLSESYSSQVKQGDAVRITFPDINKTIEANVTYASKSINPLTRTFQVEINLPNDNDLRPNMVAALQILDYQKPGTIVVPINTIQQVDGEDVVFVSSKKGSQLVAKKTKVKVGKTYNGMAEILEGLNEGDQLITTGFQDLTDGQSLKL